MNRRTLLGLIAGTVVLPGMAHAVPLPLPPPPPRRLHLVNAHTNETFDDFYRDDNGPVKPALEQLTNFLRDFHSGATHAIDVDVLDFLATVMTVTGQTSAIIMSAYRSPETNAALEKTNFGVAENSQHLYGRALDIHFENGLPEAMRAARALQRGGVGWYPQSSFMHIDSGPVRNWDLEESGLGKLLRGRGHIHFNDKGELVVLEGGHQVPLTRGRGPLVTVRQRLGRLHQLARAEFLQRHHL